MSVSMLPELERWTYMASEGIVWDLHAWRSMKVYNNTDITQSCHSSNLVEMFHPTPRPTLALYDRLLHEPVAHRYADRVESIVLHFVEVFTGDEGIPVSLEGCIRFLLSK